MKKSKKILVFLILPVVMCIAIIAWKADDVITIRKDIARLQNEAYDTVFMSMYPINNYDEEDYMYYRGMDTVQTEYRIPNGKVLHTYMSSVQKSDNVVNRVYVGVDPEHIYMQDMENIIRQNPNMIFEVTLAYPQISYWTKMSDGKFEKTILKYQEFAESILAFPNVNLYAFGCEEWLIGNPDNYTDSFDTNAEVSEFLMCNTDEAHVYEMTVENMQSKFADLRLLVERYRNDSFDYPNAKEMDIVFFGDSIIGNYTDSLSIPGVVQGLSGAKVYNCGYGGKTAALSAETPIPFPDVVDAFLNQNLDMLPADSQVYAGVKSYWEQGQTDRTIMFVVNYGLNDFFYGVPVNTDDKYDVCSYSGAIRVAVEKLKNAYPQAKILLMSPHFTIYYNYGMDKAEETGGVLEDYADAIVDLATELDVEVMDNFRELSVTQENWTIYQPDGTHLNEKGRFLLGSKIAQRIQND